MSDEKTNANGEEPDGIRGGSENDDEIIDAEFDEHKPSPLIPTLDDDDDAIAGDVVNDRSRVSDVKFTSDPDPFAELLSQIPTGTDISVVVKRKADNNLKFRNPCVSPKHQGTLYWDGKSVDQIYNDVAQKYGGGRFQFQLQYGGSMRQAWEATIDDPPFLSDVEKLAKSDEPTPNPSASHQFAPAPAPPPVAVNPVEELRGQFAMMKDVIALSRELQPPTPAPIVQEQAPLKDQLVMKAFDSLGSDPDIAAAVIRKAFGVQAEGEGKKGFGDIAMWAITHPEQIAAVASVVGPILPSILGFFGAGKRDEPQRTIVMLPSDQSPAAAPSPSASTSLVKLPDPPPQPEAPPATENAATEAPAASIPVVAAPSEGRIEW